MLPPVRKNFTALTVVTVLASTGAAIADQSSEIEYRGRTLIGSDYPGANNADFFHIAKQGIDLAETLPRAKWNNTGAVKTIRYNPPSADRQSLGVTRHLVSVFTKAENKRARGEMIVFRRADYSSGLEIALGMANGGAYIRAKRSRYDLKHLASSRSDQYRVECQADIAEWRALRYLHPVSAQIRKQAVLLRERGCWQMKQPRTAPGQRTASTSKKPS